MNKKIIIEGQEAVDWRKAMDESNIYIAIIDDEFCNDLKCVEQTLYAKNQQIPTIVIIIEGAKLSIPDLFDGINVIDRFMFNEDNKLEVKKKLLDKLNELGI